MHENTCKEYKFNFLSVECMIPITRTWCTCPVLFYAASSKVRRQTSKRFSSFFPMNLPFYRVTDPSKTFVHNHWVPVSVIVHKCYDRMGLNSHLLGLKRLFLNYVRRQTLAFLDS